MKHILYIILSLIPALLTAQQPVTIDLWPDSESVNTQPTTDSFGILDSIAKATLTIYPAPNNSRNAIIACPGGGYKVLATQHEGHALAEWFNSLGYTYAVLIYHMPEGNNQIPLKDVHRAMEILHSGQWQMKQIGIMGFSAGGHLASTAATHFTPSTRPDFQILFYPVITMNRQLTHMGTRTHLLGTEPTDQMVQLYSNERQVTPQTPPAFIIHCSDDTAVPVQNSLDYYTALHRNGVAASLHIYPQGGHGWGWLDSFPYKEEWKCELRKWLKELK